MTHIAHKYIHIQGCRSNRCMWVCVCVRAHERARVCVVCSYACACVHVRACARACVHSLKDLISLVSPPPPLPSPTRSSTPPAISPRLR